MAQTQGIPKGDPLQKMGSAGFVLGTILVVLGSLLLPPAAVPKANWQEGLPQVGAQAPLLQACALLIAFGYWGVMVGFAGVYRSIAGRASAWARVGFYFTLIGTAMTTIGMSLDISYPAAIVNWLAAPATSKEIAYTLVLAVPAFGRGLFPMAVIAIWLSFTLMGVAMIHSAQYPRWLGLVGVILGIPGVLLGISQAFTGREATIVLYIALVIFTILWWLTIGIWVGRKAW